MGKKKGKNADPAKKAALQAKKEAKAEKSTLKRLKKESIKAGESGDTVDRLPVESSEALDALLNEYRDQDKHYTTTHVVAVEGFPLPRANASFTLYEDTKKKNAEVYLFGGEYYDGIENIVVDHLLKYDLAKSEWKRVYTPVTPPARCAHSCVYYNHSLYIFGGEMASADEYMHYKDLWRYDIKAQTWTEIKPSRVGMQPSARSGHAAVVWKHYMIVFGGFYEAMRDTPRWFNDLCVLDLQTEQWLDVPHSKLASRPEKRSAMNAALIGDDVIIHGGFSKLGKNLLSRSSSDVGGGDTVSTPETKVHTDAWACHLKPLLSGKAPTWERLTSSIQRSQIMAIKNPCGRSGTGSLAFKNRVLVYGGVVDKEHHHHKLESVFYNDLHAFDPERRKWFPVNVKKASSGSRRRRRKDSDDEDGWKEAETKTDLAEGCDSDLEDDGDDENEPENTGWDLIKLRSNMFAFVDGNGNLIYEKIEEDKGPAANSDDEEEEKQEDDSSSLEVEETKQEEVDDASSEGGGDTKQGLGPAAFQAIPSSSVMAVNEKTQVPEAVARNEPLPRIKPNCIVSGHTLFVYGGLLEVGDREVTLDDLWSFDLRKRDHWECIYAGSMHKQVWRGAIHDDDDSYISANHSGARQDDESDDSDDGEADASEDRTKEAKVTSDNKAPASSSRSEIRQEIVDLNEKHNLADDHRTPRPDEALSDFYARTGDYWNKLAADTTRNSSQASLSSKELKRESFALARERFSELEPILERLKGLQIELKALKEGTKESKRKQNHRAR